MTQTTNRDFNEIGQQPRRERIVWITNEDYEVQLEDRAIRWSGTGQAANTITLPPVAKAKGLIFTISATIAGSAALTVEDYNDDSDVWSDLTLDADNDRVALDSDGIQWWEFQNAIAT
jgi:hypothetical protein